MARFRQGSTHRPLRARAYTDAGDVDFAREFPGGVTFRMVLGATVIGGLARGDSAGNLVYQWGPHDLDTPGTYAAVFVATDADGRTEMFPTDGNLEIVVVPGP